MIWGNRVALVNPPYAIGRANYITPQLGLHTVASWLRSADEGCNVQIVDQALELAEERILPGPDLPERAAVRLAEITCDSYGFTVQCFNLPIAIAIVRRLKLLVPERTVVIGGHHAKLVGDRISRAFPFVDHVASGDEELLGLNIKEAAQRYPFVCPDYSLGPTLARYSAISRQPAGLVEISRGCPYRCDFCSIPDAFGRKVKRKPISAVIHEVKLMAAEGVSEIHLVDDILTLNRRYLGELLRGFGALEQRPAWTGMTRADLVDREMLLAMGEAGCTGLLYGIESGAVDTLAAIGKRADRYPDLIELTHWHCEAGIRPTYYFLINHPSEGESALEETLREVSRISVVDAGACRLNLVRLLPGTPLGEEQINSVVPDFSSPYAETLRMTVSDSCQEVWGLVEAHPEIFMTYYTVPTSVPQWVLHEVGREGAWLYEHYPLSMAAISGREKLIPFFLHLASRPPGQSLLAAVEVYLESIQPGLSELPRLEAWRSAWELGIGEKDHLVSRVDLGMAQALALSDPGALPRSIQGETRIYRISA